jgi:hypothetical protein
MAMINGVYNYGTQVFRQHGILRDYNAKYYTMDLQTNNLITPLCVISISLMHGSFLDQIMVEVCL